MLIPDHKCVTCAAVYPAKSWGDCGACPGCGGTTYTHEPIPVDLAAHESGGSVPARPIDAKAIEAIKNDTSRMRTIGGGYMYLPELTCELTGIKPDRDLTQADQELAQVRKYLELAKDRIVDADKENATLSKRLRKALEKLSAMADQALADLERLQRAEARCRELERRLETIRRAAR